MSVFSVFTGRPAERASQKQSTCFRVLSRGFLYLCHLQNVTKIITLLITIIIIIIITTTTTIILVALKYEGEVISTTQNRRHIGTVTNSAKPKIIAMAGICELGKEMSQEPLSLYLLYVTSV